MSDILPEGDSLDEVSEGFVHVGNLLDLDVVVDVHGLVLDGVDGHFGDGLLDESAHAGLPVLDVVLLAQEVAYGIDFGVAHLLQLDIELVLGAGVSLLAPVVVREECLDVFGVSVRVVLRVLSLRIECWFWLHGD